MATSRNIAPIHDNTERHSGILSPGFGVSVPSIGVEDGSPSLRVRSMIRLS